jgi:predicted AAA+ superfamily ATPase
MFRRHFQAPDTNFFLFGPRGCGKTTWYKDHFKEQAVVFDLLNADLFRELTARPELLRKRIEADTSHDVFILDEIQRIPDLLPVVHSLIVERPKLRFVLTGSNARKLKRQSVDLLAGRALLNKMYPFTAVELGDAFNLDEALTTGLIPLIRTDKDPGTRLRSYVSLYIQEEVNYEGLARNIGGFNRFLQSITLSHTNVLNVSTIARDCQVERKTVESYIAILEDLLIVRRIYPFQKRAKRRVIDHPKLYFFDAGVFHFLRPKGPLDLPESVAGTALEGLVENHLRAWIDYSGSDAQCFFWRTPAGTEVDFVVYGQDTFIALEVKNTARVRPEDLRGLRTFCADYPEAAGVLLYRGDHRQKEGNILCVPVEEFLKNLDTGKRTLSV